MKKLELLVLLADVVVRKVPPLPLEESCTLKTNEKFSESRGGQNEAQGPRVAR